MIFAIVAVVASGAAIGGLHITQSAQAGEPSAREGPAVAGPPF